jgi:hypothetical protein
MPKKPKRVIMIFQYTYQLILDGKKTQTRRIIDAEEKAVKSDTGEIEAVLHKGRKKWVVGQSYGVQPSRTAKQVARIRLTRIRQEKVSDISEADVQAEGFNSRAEFYQTWQTLHGENSLDWVVWVLDFEVV